jgi:hypothetical protein
MTWTCLLGCGDLECRDLAEVVDHVRLIHPDQELPERWRFGYPIHEVSDEWHPNSGVLEWTPPSTTTTVEIRHD